MNIVNEVKERYALKYFYRVVEKERCEGVFQYCTEDSDGGITILREIDPMEVVNSGLGWGYIGGGPSALTELLMMELTKDKFSSLTNTEYTRLYNTILDSISKIDNNSDFKMYLDTLEEICNKETK